MKKEMNRNVKALCVFGLVVSILLLGYQIYANIINIINYIKYDTWERITQGWPKEFVAWNYILKPAFLLVLSITQVLIWILVMNAPAKEEVPSMTAEDKEKYKQKLTADYNEQTRRLTARYNDMMNRLNLTLMDNFSMSEEEKEQQRQSLTADYNDQMGRLTVKYRNTMNKLQ